MTHTIDFGEHGKLSIKIKVITAVSIASIVIHKAWIWEHNDISLIIFCAGSIS